MEEAGSQRAKSDEEARGTEAERVRPQELIEDLPPWSLRLFCPV